MKPPVLTVIQRAVPERLPALGLSSGARVLDAPSGGTAARKAGVTSEWSGAAHRQEGRSGIDALVWLAYVSGKDIVDIAAPSQKQLSSF
jgi:hypothetical protein